MKMKILHIVECAGGVERYLAMLLPRLEDTQTEQFLVCSEDYDTEKFSSMVKKVIPTSLRQTFSPLAIIRQVNTLRQIINDVEPDIIYCHSSFAGGLGRLAVLCSRSAAKIIYNPHGWAFNIGLSNGKRSKKQLLYLVIERLLAKMTDRIVCISKAERISALENKICMDTKLTVIENGIEIDKVEKASPFPRADLGINDTDIVIGMIGRLSEQKAPDIFIQTAKLIKEQVPNVSFIIVGDGPMRTEVESYAQKHGIRLRVTGWTDEPYRYLQTFDIAILLSRWEGFGLAIAEYMAADKNVIATRVDAIPTLIEDRKEGILVPANCPDQASNAAIYIIQHPEEASAMRNQAKQKVQHYDISRVVDEHKSLFKEISM